MKKICKVILAAAAIVALAVPAMAADKLIVKPAAGTINALTVTDNGLIGTNVVPQYAVDVATYGSATDSTLHFAYNGADNGGWLSSVGENNFWISSGAVLKNNVWTQKGVSGKSIFFGSGDVGFRAFVNQGATVGGPVTLTEAYRLDYAGNFGLGTKTPQQRLDVNGGVRISTVTAQPTCDATTSRGTFWVVQGAAGVKDSVQVCAKDAANAYAWRNIY